MKDFELWVKQYFTVLDKSLIRTSRVQRNRERFCLNMKINLELLLLQIKMGIIRPRSKAKLGNRQLVVWMYESTPTTRP